MTLATVLHYRADCDTSMPFNETCQYYER